MLELTVASLIGVLLYSVTAACCLFAVQNARNYHASAMQTANWLAIAAVFVGLIALRGFLIEDWIEQTIRQLIRDTGGYNERRRYQAVIAIVMSGLALVVLFVGYRSFVRVRCRSDMILFFANAACVAMIGLIAFRMLSLHAVDRVLYDFKVNWVIDIGTTIVVAGCAVVFARSVKSQPNRNPSKPSERTQHVARALRRGPPQ